MEKSDKVVSPSTSVWDFGFRYNLHVLDLAELEVLMIKYEIELKRQNFKSMRFTSIQKILAKIYREIMQRKINHKLTEIGESKVN